MSRHTGFMPLEFETEDGVFENPLLPSMHSAETEFFEDERSKLIASVSSDLDPMGQLLFDSIIDYMDKGYCRSKLKARYKSGKSPKSPTFFNTSDYYRKMIAPHWDELSEKYGIKEELMTKKDFAALTRAFLLSIKRKYQDKYNEKPKTQNIDSDWLDKTKEHSFVSFSHFE